MQHAEHQSEPAAGVLYLVGTPIGNIDDLSPRARRMLQGVDRIACEDTRRSGRLLQALGISARLLSFHQHNQSARMPQLLAALAAGEERTLVLFEAPHRLVALLEDLLAVLGDRPLQVARELTKRHEQQVGPTVAAALEHFRHTSPLGECTLVLGGAAPPEAPLWDEASLRSALQSLVEQGLSHGEAARSLAASSGHSRRALYALLHREGQADG